MLADASIKVDSFCALLGNRIFLSSFFSLCAAQLLKVIRYIIVSGSKRDKKELFQVLTWRTGGMPSSHAALVCSLCASVAFVEGIASNLFIFAFWFALLVLRDAMGVRQSAGQQAKVLNDLSEMVGEKTGQSFKRVKEIQGHTPPEVVAGGLLGIFIATCLNLFL
jgi:acid phosphatase family membrane protein YuiD